MDNVTNARREKNPRESAGFLNLISFCYTTRLFRKGFKTELQENDIYEVINTCSSQKCGNKFEKEVNKVKVNTTSTIVRLILKIFWKQFALLGFVQFTWKLIKSIAEPHAIGKIVSYFNASNKQKNTISFDDALFYSLLMISIKFVNCFYFQNYLLYLQQLGMQVRTSFCSLIYRKSLKITPNSLDTIGIGNIITVITKDALAFEENVWMVNELWIEVICSCIVTYLIYNKMGIESLAGIALLISFIPLQGYAINILKIMRLKANKKTDERLQVTQETLSGIKIIKMYTWEVLFNNKVDEKRKKELKLMLKAFFLKSAMVIFGIFTSRLSFYAMVMLYIHLNSVTSAETIFYVMSCFADLRRSIGVIIPLGFAAISDMYVSIARINNILNAPELKNNTYSHESHKTNISIDNATVDINNKKAILKNITWQPKSGLTIVTGPLGCGKSSLLKLCLNDFPLTQGNVFSEGMISYSSQDPWLFPSSIKQNILFGEKYDEARYKEVVRVCSLNYDLSLMDNGDETIVADRGINLSRGQQARINLARAVYKESDIYLLDDPLNALDVKIQDSIFSNCITGFLKEKTVVMVSHNKKHIDSSDHIVVMKEGRIKHQGKSEEVLNDVLKEVEEEFEKIEKEDESKDEETNEVSCLLEKSRVYKKVYSEVKKEGSVEYSVYKRYFKFGGGFYKIIIVFVLFILNEMTFSLASKFLTLWINTQEKIIGLKNNLTDLSNDTLETSTIFSVTTNLSSYYISNVTESLHQAEALSSFRINTYTFLMISCFIIEIIKSFYFLNFARIVSKNIHRAMVTTLTRTVMTFYDNYFIGNILNRFSQDINIVDELVPLSLHIFIDLMFSSAGMVTLIISVSWIFAIPSSIFVLILVMVRYIYMPAARSLKRLESATRSPLIGHLNASMEGITTIRAFKAQKTLESEFDRHQDLYTSAHFTSFSIQRAFGFFMELISLIFIILVVFKFLFFNDKEEAGDVGLAITKAVALTQVVTWGIIHWAELENNMTSVERVLEYTELPEENYDGIEVDNWPNVGTISYENVSLTYSGSHEKCLKNVCFNVGAKEKIGIVGRTGAGKSSIISTLFRLYDFSGTIKIDGVNIKNLSLHFLRDKISIIPQEPILFQGTVRTNLDPFEKYTDDQIWSVIEKVKMKNAISDLNLEITDHGSNFSTGQRQLLSLARAIIRKNKIVVLDEATANMDLETEVLIHETIVENFQDCTVLIVAHRIESILECNKVLVLDKGQIKEFGDPHCVRYLKDVSVLK